MSVKSGIIELFGSKCRIISRIFTYAPGAKMTFLLVMVDILPFSSELNPEVYKFEYRKLYFTLLFIN